MGACQLASNTGSWSTPNAILYLTSPVSNFESMPEGGLEPPRDYVSADFESAASAIPPLRQQFKTKLGTLGTSLNGIWYTGTADL